MGRLLFITKVSFEGEKAEDIPRIQKVTQEFFTEQNGFDDKDVRAIASLQPDQLYCPTRRGFALSVRRVA